jgi:hypothetical protein
MKKRRQTDSPATSAGIAAALVDLAAATRQYQTAAFALVCEIQRRGFPAQHLPRRLANRAGLEKLSPNDWPCDKQKIAAEFHNRIETWCNSRANAESMLRNLSAETKRDLKRQIGDARSAIRWIEIRVTCNCSDYLLSDFDGWLTEWALSQVSGGHIEEDWLEEGILGLTDYHAPAFRESSAIDDGLEIHGLSRSTIMKARRVIGGQHQMRPPKYLETRLHSRCGLNRPEQFLCLAVLRECGIYKGHQRVCTESATSQKAAEIVEKLGLKEFLK